jgi:hypothetical protein
MKPAACARSGERTPHSITELPDGWNDNPPAHMLHFPRLLDCKVNRVQFGSRLNCDEHFVELFVTLQPPSDDLSDSQ